MEVFYEKDNLFDLEIEERAHKGLFLAFQYPLEIPGVNNVEFLRMAYNAKQKHLGKPESDALEFNSLLQAIVS